MKRNTEHVSNFAILLWTGQVLMKFLDQFYRNAEKRTLTLFLATESSLKMMKNAYISR